MGTSASKARPPFIEPSLNYLTDINLAILQSQLVQLKELITTEQKNLNNIINKANCLRAEIEINTRKSASIEEELRNSKSIQDELKNHRLNVKLLRAEIVIETRKLKCIQDEIQALKRDSAGLKVEISNDEQLSKKLKAELHVCRAYELKVADDRRKAVRDLEMLKESHSKIRQENRIYEEQWRLKRDRQLAEELELDERLITLNENLAKPKNHLAECDSDEVATAKRHFDNFKVLGVQKFVNADLQAEYAATKKKFIVRHGIQNVRELFLFTAVQEKHIPEVLQDGFNVRVTKSGESIFFVKAERTDRYFKREIDKKHMILSAVLNCDKCQSIKSEISINYVDGELTSVRVYTKNASLPMYLIKYSKKEIKVL